MNTCCITKLSKEGVMTHSPDCRYSPTPTTQQSWEEEFIEMFPNVESGIQNYGTFCAIRDFIREQIKLAEERGRQQNEKN